MSGFGAGGFGAFGGPPRGATAGWPSSTFGTGGIRMGDAPAPQGFAPPPFGGFGVGGIARPPAVMRPRGALGYSLIGRGRGRGGAFRQAVGGPASAPEDAAMGGGGPPAFRVEDAPAGTALFMRGVPGDATEASLMAHFCAFGAVRAVTLDRHKGMGVVAFGAAAEAAAAQAGGSTLASGGSISLAPYKGRGGQPPAKVVGAASAVQHSSGPVVWARPVPPVAKGAAGAGAGEGGTGPLAAVKAKAALLLLKKAANSGGGAIAVPGPLPGALRPPQPAVVVKRVQAQLLPAKAAPAYDPAPAPAPLAMEVLNEGVEEAEDEEEEEEEQEGEDGEWDGGEEEEGSEGAEEDMAPAPAASPPAPAPAPMPTVVLARPAVAAPRPPPVPLPPFAFQPPPLPPASREEVVGAGLGAVGGDGIIGTCPTMCPVSEVEGRKDENTLLRFELPWPERGLIQPGDGAVKKHRRSAAGDDATVPEEVRPPPVLVRTLDYLIHTILDADAGGPDPRFVDEGGRPRPPSVLEVQAFLWDRMRAVCKDWKSQNYREGGRNDAWAIESLERITRAHIILNYECLSDPVGFKPLKTQNEEQLNAHLKQLLELYDDARARTRALAAAGRSGALTSPCEAEFRAYYILLQMGDETAQKSLFTMLGALPSSILRSRELRHAMGAWTALSTGNTVRFFRLVKGSSFLPAALLSRYLPRVREDALRVLVDAHCVPPAGSVPCASGMADTIPGPDGVPIPLARHLKWEDVADMLRLPCPRAGTASAEERTAARERVEALCNAHGVGVEHVAEGKGIIIKPRKSTFITTTDAAKADGQAREPWLIADLAHSVPRANIADGRRWAATSACSAFSPVGSNSGVFLSGSRFATELVPGAPGAVQLASAAPTSVLRRVGSAAAPIGRPPLPSPRLPLSLPAPLSALAPSFLSSNARVMPPTAVKAAPVTSVAACPSPPLPMPAPAAAWSGSSSAAAAVQQAVDKAASEESGRAAEKAKEDAAAAAATAAAAAKQQQATAAAAEAARIRQEQGEAAAAREAEAESAREAKRAVQEADAAAHASLLTLLEGYAERVGEVRSLARAAGRALEVGAAGARAASSIASRLAAAELAGEEGEEEGWRADPASAAALDHASTALLAAIASVRLRAAPTSLPASTLTHARTVISSSLGPRVGGLEGLWGAWEGRAKGAGDRLRARTDLLQRLSTFLLRKWRKAAVERRRAKGREGRAGVRSVEAVPAGGKRRRLAGTGGVSAAGGGGGALAPVPAPPHSATRLAALYSSTAASLSSSSRGAWAPCDVAALVWPGIAAKARGGPSSALTFKLVILTQALGGVEEGWGGTGRLMEGWVLTKLSRVLRSRRPARPIRALAPVPAGEKEEEVVVAGDEAPPPPSIEASTGGAHFGLSGLKRRLVAAAEGRAGGGDASRGSAREEEEEGGGDVPSSWTSRTPRGPLDLPSLDADAREGATLTTYSAAVGGGGGRPLGLVVRALGQGAGKSAATAALAGAQALLILLHVDVEADAPEGGREGSLLLTADWGGAQARIASALLPFVPDAPVSLVLALLLHTGVRGGGGEGLRTPWASALDVASLRRTVSSRLGLPSLPSSVVRGAAVALLNPALLVTAVRAACEGGEGGEDPTWPAANIQALAHALPQPRLFPSTDLLGPAGLSCAALEGSVSYLGEEADAQPRVSPVPVSSLLASVWAACAPAGPSPHLLDALTALSRLRAGAEAMQASLCGSAGLLRTSALRPPPELGGEAEYSRPPGACPDPHGLAALDASLALAPLRITDSLASALSTSLQALGRCVQGEPARAVTLGARMQAVYAVVQSLLSAHVACLSPCTGAQDVEVGPAAGLDEALYRVGWDSNAWGVGATYEAACALLAYPFTPACLLLVPAPRQGLARAADRIIRAWAKLSLRDLAAAHGAGQPISAPRPPPWASLVSLIVEDRLAAAEGAAEEAGGSLDGPHASRPTITAAPSVLLRGLLDAQAAAAAAAPVDGQGVGPVGGEGLPIAALASAEDLGARREARARLASVLLGGGPQDEGVEEGGGAFAGYAGAIWDSVQNEEDALLVALVATSGPPRAAGEGEEEEEEEEDLLAALLRDVGREKGDVADFDIQLAEAQEISALPPTSHVGRSLAVAAAPLPPPPPSPNPRPTTDDFWALYARVVAETGRAREADARMEDVLGGMDVPPGNAFAFAL
jgi:hypothetical protein